MIDDWMGLRTVRARKRAYSFGSIFEAPKAVYTLSFNLERKTRVCIQHTLRTCHWFLGCHTSFESASAPISAALPLITVGCHASSSSISPIVISVILYNTAIR